jgi:hypothetical protein
MNWERKIENELSALRRRVDQIPDRLPTGTTWRQLRPARVVADAGAFPAPHASGTLVYPIVFLDGTYTKTAGAQTIAWTPRAAAP